MLHHMVIHMHSGFKELRFEKFFEVNTGGISSPHLNFHSIDTGQAVGWKGVVPIPIQSFEKYMTNRRERLQHLTKNNKHNMI